MNFLFVTIIFIGIALVSCQRRPRRCPNFEVPTRHMHFGQAALEDTDSDGNFKSLDMLMSWFKKKPEEDEDSSIISAPNETSEMDEWDDENVSEQTTKDLELNNNEAVGAENETPWTTSDADGENGTDQTTSDLNVDDEAADNVTEEFDSGEERVKRDIRILRKEIRQMSREELDLFFQCLQNIKNNGQYDFLATAHKQWKATDAHYGAAFLVWHRYFILRMEIAMRRSNRACRSVYMPTLDCTLDAGLPRPSDSVLWTSMLLGTAKGDVHDGRLCKDWKVIPSCEYISPFVRRSMSDSDDMSYCRRERILSLLTPRTLQELMTPERETSWTSAIEGLHQGLHCTIGGCKDPSPGEPRCDGHMGCLDCSQVDAVFFLHHANFDCLWREWEQLPGRSNSYPRPPAPGGRGHDADAKMEPFMMKNEDVLDPANAHYFTGCYPRPSRPGFYCTKDEDCDSDLGYIFCDTRRCSCVSKVREGGLCTGLRDNACYCAHTNMRPRCRGNWWGKERVCQCWSN